MISALLLLSTAATAPLPPPAISSVGTDVTISQPAGRVIVLLGDVSISAPVAGDVVVWGGDVRLEPGASVSGNLSVFFGEITTSPAIGTSPPVRGVISSPGSLLRLYLAEIGRAPWEASPRAAWGMRLIALSGWLAGSLLLLYLLGAPFARAALTAENNWTGTLLAGALGVLTLFLAAAASLALFPAALSVPIALALAALAVAAKVFGMGALFLLLGQKMLRDVGPARRPAALAVGFAVLGGVSLVPLLGPLLWSAASVVAVGTALLSRFGRPAIRVAIA
jgi:hypothetical protein